MKERPILFSAPMVRALLDGSKTQTRRAFNDRTKFAFDCAARIGEVSFFLEQNDLGKNDLGYVLDFCPYGKVGDRLWVREAILQSLKSSSMPCGEYESYWSREKVEYCADNPSPIERFLNPNQIGSAWMSKRPSIHMPRWASRITLEITAVRVERLNDISEADAKAEGLKYHSIYNEWGGVEAHPDSSPMLPQWRWYESPIEAFKNLWESINGTGSWQANPWVWRIEFKRV